LAVRHQVVLFSLSCADHAFACPVESSVAP
jgi:hypothetical protein